MVLWHFVGIVVKRRTFLKGAVCSVLGAALNLKFSEFAQAQEVKIPNDEIKSFFADPIVASWPVLQNFSENSIGIVFAVNCQGKDSSGNQIEYANARVLFRKKDSNKDFQIVKCGGFRVTDMDNMVIRTRLTNLEPSTEYEYKIEIDHIEYRDNHYQAKVTKTFKPSNIFTFKTAGENTDSHFCIINDIAGLNAVLEPCMKTIHKDLNKQPSCILLNGDIAMHPAARKEFLINWFLNPIQPTGDALWNSWFSYPFLFCPGDFEQIGFAARHLEDVWMFRQNDERLSKHWDLGRNFAVRIGEIAVIGLDTGLGKFDDKCGELYNYERYIEAQAEWLEDTLKNNKEIKNAKYLVAACHVPLYDSTSTYHKDGEVKTFSDYCYSKWNRLLTEHGCSFVFSGHKDDYKWSISDPSEDKSLDDRSWVQVIGGGLELVSSSDFHTQVIDVSVSNDKLLVVLYDNNGSDSKNSTLYMKAVEKRDI